MRASDWLKAAGIAAAAISAAGEAEARSFDIAPGRLGDVAGRIGATAGATITVPDPELADRPSPGVRGRFALREALARALRGTGAEAEYLRGGVVRIVRTRHPLPPRRPAAAPVPARLTAEPPAEPQEIIVTGSKQRTPLDLYPGAIRLVEIGEGWTNAHGSDGSAAIVRMVPSLSSTSLGRGREKLFIRGVADSSFTGPTQAVTGQYFGDVRLTYNAPDPSLNLFDMQRAEILVGPQAPLYGAGSLGGIIRLVPNVPDTERHAAAVSVGAGFTRGGDTSRDGALMANVPLAKGRWALRAVVSGGTQGGYIDAPRHGLRNINGTRSRGHRIAIRGADLGGWTLDLGHVGQSIASDYGQYRIGRGGRLGRPALIAEPFRSDYELSYLTATKALGRAELVSTTAFVRHDLRSLFDASALLLAPGHYREANDIEIASQETRVSGGGRRSPWVLGASAINSRSSVSQTLALAEGPALRIDVVNRNFDAALFGQATRPLGADVSVTLGGRLTYARIEAYVKEPRPPETARSFRDTARFSRSIALDWRPAGAFSAYLRYDQGFRAGGLTAFPTLFGLVAQTYKPDTLDTIELGVAAGDIRADGVSFKASLFRTLWHDMQADLVDESGLPYTANVGNGRITGLDAELAWQPAKAVELSAAAFLNRSRLADGGGTGGTLPNVAGAGGRVAARWTRDLGPDARMSVDAALRYVGRSRLGVGSKLDVPQGDYAVLDLGARLAIGRLLFSLGADNLLDARGNIFAYGNPFSVVRRDQATPLRPRTIRIGLDFGF